MLPKFQKNNIIVSSTVLPAYEWNTSSGKLLPHRYGIYSLYGAIFVSLSWGVAATLFLNQLYIGMSTVSCTICIACIVTVALSNHGKSQFSRAISSLKASEFLVLNSDGGGDATNSKSFVEKTIQEALNKANKLFSEAGKVEQTFGTSTTTTTTTTEENKEEKSSSTVPNNLNRGAIPRPSGNGKKT